MALRRSRVRIPLGPPVQLELPDTPVEQFFVSLRFEHRHKLDQLGIEISSLDTKIGR